MTGDNPYQKFFGDNYRAVIIIAGIAGLFASLGLGRFSLGMMLPAMGEGLDLSYVQMGVISTVNFCGYLMAVLLSGLLSRWLGARYLISLALLLVGVSMILVGYSSSYFLIVILYLLTGIGSALSNVPIMALVSTWFTSSKRGRVAGLFVMGNGLGILFSGKTVPFVNQFGYGWQLSWRVLGGVVLLIALLSFSLIRNRPDGGLTGELLQSRKRAAGDEAGQQEKQMSRGLLLHCGGIYFLFGFSYVIYVTFMVTALVQERGLTEQAAGDLWSWVGLLSLVSGPLFGYISDGYGRKVGLVIVFVIQAIAYLLVASNLTMVAVYLSICCFSIVAWSVPSIIAALVGDYAGAKNTAAMFGYVTFIFGIGQILGPAAAGYLAEVSGSFSYSFYMAGGVALTAVLLSLLLPKRSSDS